MWGFYLHHITVHFPIVLAFVMAGVGVWYLKVGHAPLLILLRVVGAAAFAITTVAVISGFVSAEAFWTADGPHVLIHHRNLGLLAWFAMAIAAGATEWGCRNDETRVARFGILTWCAVALAAVGAGHWGGSGVHSDRVPWQDEPPALRESAPSDDR